MSNNKINYNAMSNKQNDTTYKPKEEKLVTEGNVVNDSPSYVAQAKPEPEAEVKVTPPAEEPPKEPVYGTVVNCLRLNVRQKPNKNSDVVTIVDEGDKLPIDVDASTDGWYNVGSGYVMKEFVTIK